MIPKKIHYCWFGRNQKSGFINECIESWKKNLPDYEIIEWNEDNFDVSSNTYTKQAYHARKWAFVSDYVRLYAIYTQGGIYLDTDIEVLKPLDDFLSDEVFTGFESNDSPITAVFGADKGNELVKKLLDYYNDAVFIKEDGSFDMTTNTHIITDDFIKMGVVPNGKKQTVQGITIYPAICFCPNNFTRIFNKPSKKSYTIHHFDQSWKAEKRAESTFKDRVRRYVVGVLRNVVGTKKLEGIKK